MKKPIRFIVYAFIFTSVSFVTLGFASLNMSALPGTITWFLITSISFYTLVKRWNKTYSIDVKERHQYIELGKTTTEPTIPDTLVINKNREFKPWSEQELIWQGKRKINITYRSEQSEITERDVELRGIWPNDNGEICFRAKCKLRNDWRTFKADNVLHVTTARNKNFNDFSDYMKEELNS